MTKKILFFSVSFIAITFLLSIPYNLKNKIQTKNIVALKETQIRDSLSYKGTIQPENPLSTVLDVPVLIDKVYVKEGDSVKKGQLLFSIKSYEEMKQIQNISNENIDLQTIIDYLLSKNNNINSIVEKYENLEQNYYAKENGIINELNIKENEITKPLQKLVAINSVDNLKLFIDIVPTDIGKIKTGMDIVFTLPSNPHMKYTGKVTSVSNVASNKIDGMKVSQYIKAEATIFNKDNNLIEGLSVFTKVYIGDEYNINVLPYTTIDQDESGEFVYILNDDKPEKRYIRTGKEVGDLTEVIEGITSKDIILDNARSIKASDIIKVKK